MARVSATWDESDESLMITRADGQEYRVNATLALAGGHKVFGVETVGSEIHVLTGPRTNRLPNRRVKFTESGTDKGNCGLYRR